MAIIYANGFEEYGTTASFMLNGDFGDNNGVLTATGPRTGSFCMRYGQGQRTRYVMPAPKTVVGVSVGVLLEALPNSTVMFTPAFFMDESNRVGIVAAVTPAGYLQIFLSNQSYSATNYNGTLLATSNTQVFFAGSWQHFEIQVKCHDTTGYVLVWIEGNPVSFNASLVNIDTKPSATTQIYQVGTGGWTIVDTNHMKIDDLVIYDDQGGINDTQLGVCSVYHLFPNADTAQSDWTRNTGSDDYAAIDESPPNDDTDYISSSVAGDTSDFDCQNLPAGIRSVLAVMPKVRDNKSASGTCELQLGVVDAGGNQLTTSLFPGTSYAYQCPTVFQVDSLAAAWTKTKVDAAQLRIKRVS